MRRDRDVPDASPIVRQEDQDEQETVGHRGDDEEISRDDLADVILQERAPGLGWRLASAPHVFRDGRLTDVDPEFQQFAMNPRCASTRVGVRHGANQHPNVGGHGRPPNATSAFPRPPQPKPPSVPGDDCLRLDDDERRPPAGPETREHDPDASVGRRESQPLRSTPLQHLQLVP
jgi:hypothetical protein